MALGRGQFHDSHGDYSRFVLSVLQKIGGQYYLKMVNVAEDVGCPKCRKQREDFNKARNGEDPGLPTPFALLGRLNGVSARMASHLRVTARLRGKGLAMNIFTSRWVLAHILSVRG